MGYWCEFCGYSDQNEQLHEATQRHRCNEKLFEYKKHKKSMHGNRHGAQVFCSVTSVQNNSGIFNSLCHENAKQKITVNVKPKDLLKFRFKISSEKNKDDLYLLGLHLAHPQEQYQMENNPYDFDNEPHLLIKGQPVFVTVSFQPADIGQFSMPIIFTFENRNIKQNDPNKKTVREVIIIREMVVIAETFPGEVQKNVSPYKNKKWKAKKYVFSTAGQQIDEYDIPKSLKILLTEDLSSSVLKTIDDKLRDEYTAIFERLKFVMNESRTKDNYVEFNHNLLWMDEKAAKKNMSKYNMTDVCLVKRGGMYALDVPGLAEKRPSLLRGDKVMISPYDPAITDPEFEFEGYIYQVEQNTILIRDIHWSFTKHFSAEARFSVRFKTSRLSLERMHQAVACVTPGSPLIARLFPEPVAKKPVKAIKKFYNPQIAENPEQKAAVEHILANTSGVTPYMVYGPPGTGKTVTIVEAIIQIVMASPKNKVWVSTASNMAADHVALHLLRHQKLLNVPDIIFRASSRDRAWNILPAELAGVSNGSSRESSYSVSNAALAKYRVIVTTLMHSAKYGSPQSQAAHRIEVSHLFIDEASQAVEAACLVPAGGLLAPRGALVLAGDPQQLGPVVASKGAKDRGLGTSLMETLYNTYPNLYGSAAPPHRHITMLVNNFRSHPDILEIPNAHFYQGKLKALAPLDPLSEACIMDPEGGSGGGGGRRGIVFHGVHSKEERIGKSPSYFNRAEHEMVKRYIKALIDDHKVAPADIGVISPYMRQVTLIKDWLLNKNLKDLEVGTVEAFQGKEKRVIIISCVRANINLLDYDMKFDLGFLVEKKRFNVAVTRAKAKLIIIGNKTCLERDQDGMWQHYMDRCRQLGTYYGQDTEQLTRTDDLLREIAIDKFNKCHLTSHLEELVKKKKKEQEAAKKQQQLRGH